MIAEATVTTRLGDITNVRTGKLDANAQRLGGVYPFFTCGEETLAIDNYAFDTEAVLLAGNGNFNVKWYKGKFNAYQRTYVIEPRGVNGKWLFYAVQAALRKITSGHRGSVIRFIRLGDIVDSTVALPPTDQQDRIVAEIEKQFSRLEAGVGSLERVQVALKRHRASVLKAACEGDWPRTTIADVATDVRYGTSAKTSEKVSAVPILRMGNISEGRLSLDKLKFLPASHSEFPALLLKPGDLLFNRTNSAELVGKTAVYHGTPKRCSFASYLIRVRLHDHYSPDFLSYYLNSIYGRQWIASVVSQQVGQANVNGTKLKALEIPCPPIAEQERIVAEVERRLSVIEELDTVASTELQRAIRLRQSILQQAFSRRLATTLEPRNL